MVTGLAVIDSRILSTLTVLYIILRATVTIAEIQCYYPEGFTIVPVYIPCNPSALGTPQCALARCRSDPNAYCISNGLCYDNGVLSRESCTDEISGSHDYAQICTKKCQNASIGIFQLQRARNIPTRLG